MGNNFHFWVFQSADSDLTLISQPISSPVHALLSMKDNTIYFHFYICPENYNRLSAMTAYNILPSYYHHQMSLLRYFMGSDPERYIARPIFNNNMNGIIFGGRIVTRYESVQIRVRIGIQVRIRIRIEI